LFAANLSDFLRMNNVSRMEAFLGVTQSDTPTSEAHSSAGVNKT
jgi:hypothetical protein